MKSIYKDSKGNLYDESCVGYEQTLDIDGLLEFSHYEDDEGNNLN